MNSSEADSNREGAPDPRLREGVRALPIPETPTGLELRVRSRIRRRRVQRAALASGAVGLLLLAAVLVWQPGSDTQPPVVHQPQPAPPLAQAPPTRTQPREIPPDDLAVLFAPPPVDSLAIVGGRNERWVATLNRLEDAK
jgi:hypothetical protein